jgi:Uma2 family endonuclease
MTVLIEERRYTPNDLVTLRGAEHCELVDGRLVEKNMGAESDWIGLRLGTVLSNHVLSTDSGWVFGAETGYLCFGGNRDRVRKPDVSFVSRSRLGRIPKGHIQVVPDLAVEVVSPNDLFSEVQVKVEEYLHAGVQMVWVVEPDTRTIVEYYLSGEVHRLRESDTLSGGSVLPGFSCSVATLFPPKEAVEPGREEVIP